jgi:hypothetical protein
LLKKMILGATKLCIIVVLVFCGLPQPPPMLMGFLKQLLLLLIRLLLTRLLLLLLLLSLQLEAKVREPRCRRGATNGIGARREPRHENLLARELDTRRARNTRELLDAADAQLDDRKQPAASARVEGVARKAVPVAVHVRLVDEKLGLDI